MSDVCVRKPGTRQLMETDVLVVGGGAAGIGAAMGAARSGSKTLLIESTGFLGGVASWTLGMPMNQMRPEGRARSVVHELLIDKLVAYGDQAVHIGEHQLYCNVDYLKVAIIDALEAVGCQYLVHLFAVDALTEGDRITGVVVATKQGLATIKAKVVIDCTGDADVAYLAGAETLMERDEPRMPSSILMNYGNVVREQLKGVDMLELRERAKETYPLIPPGWAVNPVSNSHHFHSIHAGTRDIKNYDVTDPFERSEAECMSRRQVLQVTAAMREFGGDKLKDIELVGTSPQICVRESRRLKGEYVLTEEDAATGQKFDDVVAYRSGYLDLMSYKYTTMMTHDVPYRALLPVTLDGLLTAGRSISATHVGMAAGKSIGNCFATGHAAGLAASLSAGEGIVPRELKVSSIQDALRKDGVDLSMGGKTQESVTVDRKP